MRRALILDTETTGLLPPPAGQDVCIEVGCILYDLVIAAPIASFSSLIQTDKNDAEQINRIPPTALKDAPAADDVWSRVAQLVERADVVLAHRAEFDQGFLPSFFKHARPWVCTKFHVEWPHGKPGDHLVHLALAHGVGVMDAHRAITDCETIARLLTRVHRDGQDLVRLIQRAMRPRKKVAALVSYDDREKAKAAGFAWDGSTKTWWRDMPVDEIAGLPFKTRELA